MFSSRSSDNHWHFQHLQNFTRRIFVIKEVKKFRKPAVIDFCDEIDHICYRVESKKEYKNMCQNISKWGELLIESPINGRLISAYRSSKEIHLYKKYSTNLIEIPSPKDSFFYPSGFEHFEVVSKISLEDLIDRFPSLQWNTKNLKLQRNRSISLKFEKYCVKFHEDSLEKIIRKELSANSQNRCLNRFRPSSQ